MMAIVVVSFAIGEMVKARLNLLGGRISIRFGGGGKLCSDLEISTVNIL